MRITVIIPLYNYAQYIGECLESCKNQFYNGAPLEDHCDYEAVVIDDCSTDTGAAVVQNFDWDMWTLLRTPVNSGYSAAKNAGIQYAHDTKSDFIVHLDADDALLPNGIETRLKMFEHRPDLDMVHGQALRWYGGSDTRGLNPNRYPHAQGVMIRTCVYWKYGLYYEALRSKADKEMWFRLGIHPESPLPRKIRDKQIKTPVALYRKHDLQMHKLRKGTAVDDEIEAEFKRRIKQLSRQGITRENTSFL